MVEENKAKITVRAEHVIAALNTVVQILSSQLS